MEQEKPVRTPRGAKVSSEKIRKDPSLQLQQYLGRQTSPEVTLFLINELLNTAEHKQLRRNVRAPINVPVSFRLGAAVHKATSYTLSQRGMFIKFPHPPAAGSELELSFELQDGGGPIRARGEVVASAGLSEAMERAAISGMSVVFTKIGKEERRRIDRVVRAFMKKVPKSLR